MVEDCVVSGANGELWRCVACLALLGAIRASLRAADGLVVSFVGANDALHQVVANDILFTEIDKADSRNLPQHIDGNQRVVRNFAEISRIAQAMRRALAEARWDDVERLMREEWKLRRTNAPGITTPLIDKLIGVARRNGARAAKVCGAGGGGCVIVFIEPGSRQRVEDAVRNHGGQPLDFAVARQGLAFQSAPQRETDDL